MAIVAGSSENKSEHDNQEKDTSQVEESPGPVMDSGSPGTNKAAKDGICIQETVPETTLPSETCESDYSGCDDDMNLPEETQSACLKEFHPGAVDVEVKKTETKTSSFKAKESSGPVQPELSINNYHTYGSNIESDGKLETETHYKEKLQKKATIEDVSSNGVPDNETDITKRAETVKVTNSILISQDEAVSSDWNGASTDIQAATDDGGSELDDEEGVQILEPEGEEETIPTQKSITPEPNYLPSDASASNLGKQGNLSTISSCSGLTYGEIVFIVALVALMVANVPLPANMRGDGEKIGLIGVAGVVHPSGVSPYSSGSLKVLLREIGSIQMHNLMTKTDAMQLSTSTALALSVTRELARFHDCPTTDAPMIMTCSFPSEYYIEYWMRAAAGEPSPSYLANRNHDKYPDVLPSKLGLPEGIVVSSKRHMDSTTSEGTSDGSGSHENLKDVGAIQIARPPVNPYERQCQAKCMGINGKKMTPSRNRGMPDEDVALSDIEDISVPEFLNLDFGNKGIMRDAGDITTCDNPDAEGKKDSNSCSSVYAPVGTSAPSGQYCVSNGYDATNSTLLVNKQNRNFADVDLSQNARHLIEESDIRVQTKGRVDDEIQDTANGENRPTHGGRLTKCDTMDETSSISPWNRYKTPQSSSVKVLKIVFPFAFLIVCDAALLFCCVRAYGSGGRSQRFSKLQLHNIKDSSCKAKAKDHIDNEFDAVVVGLISNDYIRPVIDSLKVCAVIYHPGLHNQPPEVVQDHLHDPGTDLQFPRLSQLVAHICPPQVIHNHDHSPGTQLQPLPMSGIIHHRINEGGYACCSALARRLTAARFSGRDIPGNPRRSRKHRQTTGAQPPNLRINGAETVVTNHRHDPGNTLSPPRWSNLLLSLPSQQQCN